MNTNYKIALAVVAGAALGAASGALRGRLVDLGINDAFMRQAARTLQSGNAALFLLIRKMTTDKVLAALRGAGGMVMRSSSTRPRKRPCRRRSRKLGQCL